MKQRETIDRLLNEMGGLLFERADGTIGPVSLETAVTTRDIAQAEIVIDGDRAGVDYYYTDISDIITSIEIWYKPILPLKDSYAAKKYCRHSAYSLNEYQASDGLNNFLTEGSIYMGMLSSAHDTIGEDRPLVLKCDHIRDEATAEKLAKLIIKWRYRLLAILELTCTYSVLDIEVTDKIGVTATVIPSIFQSKSWLVVDQKIIPHTIKEPSVKLTLLELGPATSMSVLDWVEVGAATGSDKTEIITGDIKAEVGGE